MEKPLEPARKKKGPKKAPAPDEVRCTATMAKGRCRFARIPVGHKPAADAPLSPFCGHHLGDLRRGGKSSDIEWGVAGAAELVGQPWLPLKAPLLALRVMATHRERAQTSRQVCAISSDSVATTSTVPVVPAAAV